MATTKRRATSSRRSTKTTVHRKTTSRSAAGRKGSAARWGKTTTRTIAKKTKKRTATQQRGMKHREMSRHSSIAHRVSSRGRAADEGMYGMSRSTSRTKSIRSRAKHHMDYNRKPNGQFARATSRTTSPRGFYFDEEDAVFYNMYEPRKASRTTTHRITTHRTTTHRRARAHR